ncbi:MAG: M13-type metalloendopeptidase [Promethearchaeota archaeon]
MTTPAVVMCRISACCFCFFAIFLFIVLFMITAKQGIENTTIQTSHFIRVVTEEFNEVGYATYTDASIMNDKVQLHDDLYEHACGRANNVVESNVNSQSQKTIQYVLGRLNHSIMESHHTVITSMYEGDYNRNMNKLYGMCKTFQSQPFHIQRTPLCGDRTFYDIMQTIDQIVTKDDATKVMGFLSRCHLISLPIRVNWKRGNRIIHYGNPSSSVLYLDYVFPTANLSILPSVVYEQLHQFQYRTNEDECMRYQTFIDLFARNFDVETFLVATQLFTDEEKPSFVCSRRTGFFNYFDELWALWKISEIQEYFQQAVELTIRNMASMNCLDSVIDSYPLSYCRAFHNRVQQFEESVQKASSFVYQFYQHAIDTEAGLKNIHIQFGGCEPYESIEEPVMFDEDDSNVRLYLQKKIESKSHVLTGDVYPYLSSENPSYDPSSRTIVIPPSFLMEPKFSLFYDNASIIGTIGFAMFHELYHALVGYDENIRRTECECDHFAVELLYSYISEFGNANINKVILTVAQMFCNEQNAYSAKKRIDSLLLNHC